MEQDVPIPENSPRTRSSQGHARSFRASHWALSSTHLTTQKMDPMTIVLQSSDSQTFNFVRSRVCWPVLFLGSMLGAVRVPSLLYFLLMHSCLFLVYIFIYFYWSKCLFIAYLMYLESNFWYIYIYIYKLFIFLFLSCVISHLYIFVTLPFCDKK